MPTTRESLEDLIRAALTINDPAARSELLKATGGYIEALVHAALAVDDKTVRGELREATIGYVAAVRTFQHDGNHVIRDERIALRKLGVRLDEVIEEAIPAADGTAPAPADELNLVDADADADIDIDADIDAEPSALTTDGQVPGRATPERADGDDVDRRGGGNPPKPATSATDPAVTTAAAPTVEATTGNPALDADGVGRGGAAWGSTGQGGEGHGGAGWGGAGQDGGEGEDGAGQGGDRAGRRDGGEARDGDETGQDGGEVPDEDVVPSHAQTPSPAPGATVDMLRGGLYEVLTELLADDVNRVYLVEPDPAVLDAWRQREEWDVTKLWDRLHMACLCLSESAAKRYRAKIWEKVCSVSPALRPPAPSNVLFPDLPSLPGLPDGHSGLDLEARPRQLAPSTRHTATARLADRLLALIDRKMPLAACLERLGADTVRRADDRFRTALIDHMGDLETKGNEDVDYLVRADEALWSLFPWPLPASDSWWEEQCKVERAAVMIAVRDAGRVPMSLEFEMGESLKRLTTTNVKVWDYPGRLTATTLRCLRLHHAGPNRRDPQKGRVMYVSGG
jgi:hypothetical protein